ncbi:hypothetical protein [Sulfurimonas sp.]|jgi:hypothetical protein|uniref:hypothetical protein n=1 Tax=Sulfurimonas sp. TaxID=2022749 RepID=UPI002A369AFA|nr:hypothetical protein [Sulfurimonas sp.]MDY0123757.1 hypothetical protein [Sulfurimonas sp.]
MSLFATNGTYSKTTETWIIAAVVFNMALGLFSTAVEVILLDYFVTTLLEPAVQVKDMLGIFYSALR